MKQSFGYKLLLVGAVFLLGPIVLTEVLGVSLYALETWVSASELFGLLLAVTGATVIYYRGKRRR